MNITINGDAMHFEESLSISNVLDQLNLETSRVIAQLNDDIVNRNQFDDVVVNDGDTLELLEFVGGG